MNGTVERCKEHNPRYHSFRLRAYRSRKSRIQGTIAPLWFCKICHSHTQRQYRQHKKEREQHDSSVGQVHSTQSESGCVSRKVTNNRGKPEHWPLYAKRNRRILPNVDLPEMSDPRQLDLFPDHKILNSGKAKIRLRRWPALF